MQSRVPLAAPSGQPKRGAARVERQPHLSPTFHVGCELVHRPSPNGRARLSPMTKRRVLFVCTHNSARSQMAEGMLRAWAGDRFEVASGGTEASAVRPEAITALGELGIDISGQPHKSTGGFVGEPWA